MRYPDGSGRPARVNSKKIPLRGSHIRYRSLKPDNIADYYSKTDRYRREKLKILKKISEITLTIKLFGIIKQ